MGCFIKIVAGMLAPMAACAQGAMQGVGSFEIDRTEVTVGAFERFVARTGFVTAAERAGGGRTFEGDWVRRPGWTWKAPFGTPAMSTEPAVHVNYAEAQAFCKWAGKRLPTDAEWAEAAYTERRTDPPQPFKTGVSYPYPTGHGPAGANCLGDCAGVRTVAHAVTSRGKGHAETATTREGVNGLYDMGANVWEWVDSGPGPLKRTRGGSWWYGADAMRADHVAEKAVETSVVYVGFRCARSR